MTTTTHTKIHQLTDKKPSWYLEMGNNSLRKRRKCFKFCLDYQHCAVLTTVIILHLDLTIAELASAFLITTCTRNLQDLTITCCKIKLFYFIFSSPVLRSQFISFMLIYVPYTECHSFFGEIIGFQLSIQTQPGRISSLSIPALSKPKTLLVKISPENPQQENGNSKCFLA